MDHGREGSTRVVHACERRRVGAVRLVEVEGGMGARDDEILPFVLRRVERVEVVDPGDVSAGGEQALDEVAPDESGGAGDEDMFAMEWHAPQQCNRASAPQKQSS
jgi:hypothetical protein